MSERERQGIRIAVVDDHEMFRAGVIATLQPYFTIVGQAADVPSAIEMIADTQPDACCSTCMCQAVKAEVARRF